MPPTKILKTLLCTATLLVLGAPNGPLCANETTHDIHQIFGNTKHALGWDTLNLKAVEKDADGRPTLERTANAANTIERRVSYYPNGKRQGQTVTVVSRDSGKILTVEKKEWGNSGKLEHRFIQDDVYTKQGTRTGGEIHIKDYGGGRLKHEIKKRFLRDDNIWELLYEANISYYDDGDMKERIREEPLDGKKQRETWAAKEGALGRKKSTQRWDGATKSWQ